MPDHVRHDGFWLFSCRVNTWILHESEAFICKALQGEAIVNLCFALNNTADESLRLAHRVKINVIRRHSSLSKKLNPHINFHAKYRDERMWIRRQFLKLSIAGLLGTTGIFSFLKCYKQKHHIVDIVCRCRNTSAKLSHALSMSG